MECAAPLPVAPKTAAALTDGAPRDYTPKHLADKILTQRSAVEGERKQVTVLFADVKGSTDLAEQLDPEEWHAILERFFKILADGVHRFEGTVNQYTGDGIMALFGAPMAHEDHAQRACYAALHLRGELRRYADELRRTRGQSFSVRMGLNSGEVVVGAIGDDLRMDYTAQGHTVNLGARMQELAAPESAYLTEHCARLAAGYFRLRDLGRFDLKGAREPVGVFELEAAGKLRTRFDASRARGLSRFIGRKREMAVLEEAFERVLSSRRGEIVAVVGEAGIGKSRLVHEFLERCRARGHRVLTAHCLAHGKAIPLLPFMELLRDLFGIEERDSDEVCRNKIAGGMIRTGDALAPHVPFMLDFLGVPDAAQPVPSMDPELRRRRLKEVIEALRGGQRGVGRVAVYEDCHWMDPASESVLDELVDGVGVRPILRIDTYRPEYRPPWARKSFFRELPLEPLGEAAIGGLLDHLLGAQASGGLVEKIAERARGNPFFAEEIVLNLAETGALAGSPGAYRLAGPVESITIPSAVESLLAARIDRRGEREKRVLHTAAVIGKTFSLALLERVSDLPRDDLRAALDGLQDAELLFEEAVHPDLEYAFKHPLTHEVALRSQLTATRQQLHRRLAGELRAIHAGHLDEKAALLAHHFEEAGEELEAARWHVRAAPWALRTDPRQACHHWERARDLLAEVPESPETLRLAFDACSQILGVGWRIGASDADAAALMAEGEKLAARTDDPRDLAILCARYAAVRGINFGHVEDWSRYGRKGYDLARRAGDPALETAVASPMLVPLLYMGRLREALSLVEEVLARAPRDPRAGFEVFGLSPYAYCLGFRGYLRVFLGEVVEAAAEIERALELAAKIDDREMQIFTLMWRAIAAGECGEPQRQVDLTRRFLALAEQTGTLYSRLHGLISLAAGLNALGKRDEAAAALEEVLASDDRRHIALVDRPMALAGLAEVLAASGEYARARELARQACEIAVDFKASWLELRARQSQARAELAAGEDGLEAAAHALDRAEALVARTGARVYAPVVCEIRAGLAAARGDVDAHTRLLRRALELFREIGATGHAERLARELEP
jgi:class 3 adenylate cyclase/tetratricopeptide (TPR) repeat protein